MPSIPGWYAALTREILQYAQNDRTADDRSPARWSFRKPPVHSSTRACIHLLPKVR